MFQISFENNKLSYNCHVVFYMKFVLSFDEKPMNLSTKCPK